MAAAEHLFYQTVNDPAAITGGSLIFLHGAGGSHLKWAALMKESINGFTQVAVDLMGHGSSPGNPADEVKAYAQSIKEFLDANSFPRPWILVGHSMGGSIALQAALTYPETVDGIILIGSGAKMPVNPTMLEQLAQGSFDTAFLKIAYGRNINPELLAAELQKWSQVSQQQLNKDFTACNNYDVSKQLGKITVPVLILVGEQDKMTPMKSSQYLQENISGSVLQIVPGAGHHLMLEKPDETISAISCFLNENFPLKD
ncbi:MAG: alpha/beta hydrolase [Syntrophomonadaceae bacterium]|jgi:pimeloyl-ACP methyl ester carboxylesterase|nr:alpha/beta hydrolase [Syntrophomonadaceae bacterium]